MSLEKAMLERLDVLVQLAIPSIPAGERETDETKILRLCDYDHPREDISKEIGKPLNRVDVVLNSLRKSGKIRSAQKDGSTVYIRLRR